MSDNPNRIEVEEHPPWQKEPLVWLVISLPLSAVIAGFFTLYLAIDSYDGLVVDDYYKQGLEINRVLDREQRAADLGIEMGVSLDAELGNVEIALSSSEAFEYPPSLVGTMTNSTRPGLDQDLVFMQQTDGVYRAFSLPLVAGRWHLIVGTDSWRTIKQISVAANGRVSISK
ncbi:MAG: FixH family protein [Gammaproteobacteria bacterium]